MNDATRPSVPVLTFVLVIVFGTAFAVIIGAAMALQSPACGVCVCKESPLHNGEVR